MAVPQEYKHSVSELNILVVDDYPIIRCGIRTLLEAKPGWKICGEAATGKAALQKVMRWKPQVVVLDLGLPDIHGLEVIPKIIEIHPQVRILALTDHDLRETASQALASGARGLVTKSDSGRASSGAREVFPLASSPCIYQGWLGRTHGRRLRRCSGHSHVSGAPNPEAPGGRQDQQTGRCGPGR
jgi:CheY-like chemotaxis protein